MRVLTTVREIRNANMAMTLSSRRRRARAPVASNYTRNHNSEIPLENATDQIPLENATDNSSENGTDNYSE